MRHNDLRDLTAKTISEVSNDTELEPKLTPLSGEDEHQIIQMKQEST